MKTLKLSEEAALRLYPTAAPEFKEMLEQNFGREFFPQKITDRIKDYDDICDVLGVDSDDDALIVEVEGFDKKEIKVVKAFIKKMRIAKVYAGRIGNNQGWLPKIGENRYYPWLRFSSGSGLVFHDADSDHAVASAASASRLCYQTAELTKDATTKFLDIENDFIDLGQ